jgi:hypothetical protein
MSEWMVSPRRTRRGRPSRSSRCHISLKIYSYCSSSAARNSMALALVAALIMSHFVSNLQNFSNQFIGLKGIDV